MGKPHRKPSSASVAQGGVRACPMCWEGLSSLGNGAVPMRAHLGRGLSQVAVVTLHRVGSWCTHKCGCACVTMGVPARLVHCALTSQGIWSLPPHPKLQSDSCPPPVLSPPSPTPLLFLRKSTSSTFPKRAPLPPFSGPATSRFDTVSQMGHGLRAGTASAHPQTP